MQIINVKLEDADWQRFMAILADCRKLVHEAIEPEMAIALLAGIIRAADMPKERTERILAYALAICAAKYEEKNLEAKFGCFNQPFPERN